jgi:hypothetical protein
MFDLNKYTTEELAMAYCELNCWEWPTILGDAPEWWEGITAQRQSEQFELAYKNMRLLMDEIKAKVGEKEVMRCWHKHFILEVKTDTEFEAWWTDAKETRA